MFVNSQDAPVNTGASLLWKKTKCYFFSPVAAAFSFEPADSFTPWPAGIWIASPVRGLRPVRAARLVRSTENQPGIVIFSPLETWDANTSNTASSEEHTSELQSRGH